VKKNQVSIVTMAILFIIVTMTAPAAEEEVIENKQTDTDRYEGKKILWVDSYHQGYEWSDGIERGILEVLNNTGAELKIVRMDTKRNDSFEFGKNAGRKVYIEAREFKPDIIIASDDNSQKYLVLLFFKNKETSVVFCGVNWDASIYGYPYQNVTGMIEVDVTEEMIKLFSQFAKGERVGYVSGDVESERKVAYMYNSMFFKGKMKSYLVKTFEEFKKAFLNAQKENDMLYIYNYTGITDWDTDAAEQFLLENTKIPTGTHNPWMSRFAVFTLARLPEEQGRYAALTALKILDGIKPSDIPLVKNRESRKIVNMKMAKAAGLVIPDSLLQDADIIGK